MNKLVAVLALVGATFSLGAYAHQPPPLFNRCEISYSVANVALGAQIGLGGTGYVSCWDGTGNGISRPVDVQMIGAGLKIGVCQASGRISAVGVGFTLNELLSAVGKVEVGSMLLAKTTVGVGGKATPLGINAQITASGTHYTGFCAGIADAQALIITAQ
jgi:hypothetical protein